MNKQILLDEYFIEARGKLLDLAAFIDRVQRAPGQADYRWASLHAALQKLAGVPPDKTRAILELMSDPGNEPAASASSKGATGAWPGFTGT